MSALENMQSDRAVFAALERSTAARLDRATGDSAAVLRATHAAVCRAILRLNEDIAKAVITAAIEPVSTGGQRP